LVHDDRKLYELLMLDNAQAGLSWQAILNKHENYRKAFDNFYPAKIAQDCK
jgi:DNA-3-methyladenine glycosylase I